MDPSTWGAGEYVVLAIGAFALYSMLETSKRGARRVGARAKKIKRGSPPDAAAQAEEYVAFGSTPRNGDALEGGACANCGRAQDGGTGLFQFGRGQARGIGRWCKAVHRVIGYDYQGTRSSAPQRAST